MLLVVVVDLRQDPARGNGKPLHSIVYAMS